VAGSGGASTIVVNAGKAVMKGYELEVQAVPLPGVTLDGSLGYTLPTYKSFPYRDPASNQLLDLAHEAFFIAQSKLTSHLGAQYSFQPLPFGVLSARVDFTYHSQRRFHPLNRSTQFNDQVKDPGQRNWDARITLADIPLGYGDAGGEISVWGRNLTNEDHVAWGIDFGALGYGGRLYGIPRSFGVDVKLTY
jgi:iron complex outermembrane receptor protein